MDTGLAALIVAVVWIVIGAVLFVVGRSTLREGQPDTGTHPRHRQADSRRPQGQLKELHDDQSGRDSAGDRAHSRKLEQQRRPAHRQGVARSGGQPSRRRRQGRRRVVEGPRHGLGRRRLGSARRRRLASAAPPVRSRTRVGNAPTAVRQQTQGNPLAAGVIAFGVGWLLSSLAPATSAEQQLGANAEAKAKELAEPLKDAGQEPRPGSEGAGAGRRRAGPRHGDRRGHRDRPTRPSRPCRTSKPLSRSS